jgi:thiamine pyrophosphokinase
MKITSIGNALRSQTRVNILKTLGKDNLRAIDVYQKYNEIFPKNPKHREFIYKELERLVNAGILDKKYDKKIKGLTYNLKHQIILIDLLKGEIVPDTNSAKD